MQSRCSQRVSHAQICWLRAKDWEGKWHGYCSPSVSPKPNPGRTSSSPPLRTLHVHHPCLQSWCRTFALGCRPHGPLVLTPVRLLDLLSFAFFTLLRSHCFNESRAGGMAKGRFFHASKCLKALTKRALGPSFRHYIASRRW